MIDLVKTLKELNFRDGLIILLMGLGMACPIQSSYFLFFVDSQKLPAHMGYFPLVGGPIWGLCWIILLFCYPAIIETRKYVRDVPNTPEGEKFGVIQFALLILLSLAYAKLFYEQYSSTVFILALLVVFSIFGFVFLFIKDPSRPVIKFVGAVVGFGVIQPLLVLLYFLIFFGILYLFAFPPVLLARCINSTQQLKAELAIYGWTGGEGGKFLAILHMFIVWPFLAYRFSSIPISLIHVPNFIYDLVRQLVKR